MALKLRVYGPVHAPKTPARDTPSGETRSKLQFMFNCRGSSLTRTHYGLYKRDVCIYDRLHRIGWTRSRRVSSSLFSSPLFLRLRVSARLINITRARINKWPNWARVPICFLSPTTFFPIFHWIFLLACLFLVEHSPLGRYRSCLFICSQRGLLN